MKTPVASKSTNKHEIVEIKRMKELRTRKQDNDMFMVKTEKVGHTDSETKAEQFCFEGFIEDLRWCNASIHIANGYQHDVWLNCQENNQVPNKNKYFLFKGLTNSDTKWSTVNLKKLGRPAGKTTRTYYARFFRVVTAQILDSSCACATKFKIDSMTSMTSCLNHWDWCELPYMGHEINQNYK